MKEIRNFTIIAHIDHGKSTLADRMIEVTNTVAERYMKDQVLDTMDLERERGITIKMQPVRMEHADHILNLIDTPGHIDFSYEVSRALRAVEGSVLLVDSTQGIQAQTMTVLDMARQMGHVIIPVLSKTDSPLARVDEVKLEVAELLGCDIEEIMETSGKTGSGVVELLDRVIKDVPAPDDLAVEPPFGGSTAKSNLQALIFDFEYSEHQGIIVYIRVMSGSVSKTTAVEFGASKRKFKAGEVGTFSPGRVAKDSLHAGEIGYIVTGIKEPGVASVGDTIVNVGNKEAALAGYMQPQPLVWASLFPESQDDFTILRQALDTLKLSDSSLSYEEESSGALGRGFRCGFLGMLHLEIIAERLKREFNLPLIVTTPGITYEVEMKNSKDGKREKIYTASHFPNDGEASHIFEPMAEITIITPSDHLGPLTQLLYEHEAIVSNTETFSGSRNKVTATLPLRELMRNFFDELKSVSSGYASLSYELTGMQEADVTRLDILVAEEIVPAFSRVVAKRLAEQEGEKAVEKLYDVLPRQMFSTKIQAQGLGRIISSKTLSAMKKDVTGHLYGGDITRKMKLREKQKKGKKKMKAMGRVNIPHEVFMKMMKG